MRDWQQYEDLYMLVSADCLPVRGATNSAFYDMTRNQIVTFPSAYFAFLGELHGATVGYFLSSTVHSSARQPALDFLNFLEANEIIMLVRDPKMFPALDTTWEYPGTIQNAVIDVSHALPDFRKLFRELSVLGCQFLEIRGFTEELSLSRCDAIVSQAQNKSFISVDLILRHEPAESDRGYIDLVKRFPLITTLTVHSAPLRRLVAVDDIDVDHLDGAPQREVRFTDQVIDSETHCGVITPKLLTIPTVEAVLETRSYNGCLNRKIAVDKNGEIRNCPSMPESFGNVRNTSLLHVAQEATFTDKWTLKKDDISICKDCEFRYACSDCRAYLLDPSDHLSKPLKCGYDPYTAKWSSWTDSEAAPAAIKHYGMQIRQHECNTR